jgi:hypothetical protein
MTVSPRISSPKISTLVSDVDGTLVTDDKKLTVRAQAAVAKLHSNRDDGFAHAVEQFIFGDDRSNAQVTIVRAVGRA